MEDFIDRHWDGEVPVRLAVIARGLDITPLGIVTAPYVAKTDFDARTVTINLEAGSLRKRFALAHAIGHFALGHLKAGQTHTDYPSAYGAQAHIHYCDRSANAFALALLMPRLALREALDAGKDAAALMRDFLVSDVALRYRVAELASHHEAVVPCGPGLD